jgi:hypothetical protein
MCDLSRELSLWVVFFLTFWCHDSDRVSSWRWSCSPGPTAHPTLSVCLAKLPFPSSGIWAAFLAPPDPRRCPHCSQGISSAPPCLKSPSTTCQSSLKVLSQWALHTHRALISLSHFFKIRELGLSCLSSLGTGSRRTVGPWWWRHPSRESHLYSLLRDWHLRDACHMLSSGQASA